MPLLKLISLFLLLATSNAEGAVTVEAGFEGLTTRVRVDTPMLGNAPGKSMPTTPARLPEPPATSASGKPVVTSPDNSKHLSVPAADGSVTRPEQAAFPATLGTGETSKVEQKGAGSSEYTASADGTAELLVFLPAYKPAQIIVRLLDLDGDEIFFKGKSLLTWERPDDKAFAPVFFKGSSDEKSMKKEKADDFSAVQNVYQFELQKGQKLQLQIAGQPEPNSYIRIKGPLE